MNELAKQTNPNLLWAKIFVDELARCGLRHACVAPGSRSTPLALAFFANRQVQIHTHLDERSAGFFGLGLALAEDYPVALLCTSGTAAANFFPAVIEANMSQVPLLVLTADRPPELRGSGANQTIDQVNLFGNHVLWSVDMALPESEAAELSLRNQRALAARALATANGLRKGPVHLNFPFRKPLEPPDLATWQHYMESADNSLSSTEKLATIEVGELHASSSQLTRLARTVRENERGLIICGPRCPRGDFPEQISRLARALGYPLLADPLSGVRFGTHSENATICGSYETYLRNPGKLRHPQVILRFGAMPTSKHLNNYLERATQAHHIHLRANGVWADEHHRTTQFLQVDPLFVCRAMLAQTTDQRKSSWLEEWLAVESATQHLLPEMTREADFDGAYVGELISLLPDNSILFAGNSLAIRHVDQFGITQAKNLDVYANRGASGIDGNVSTGLGIAATAGQPITILVGDITFYHDSNGLFALKDMNRADIKIVVLNNNGGGIFQRLPIARFDPPYGELFQVPHHLDFSSIAQSYDLDYVQVASRKAFTESYLAANGHGNTRLIEIQTDAEENERRRQEIELNIAQLASP